MPDRHQVTQTERVVRWFRDHPGSTVNEARDALWLHVTARMSDARKQGVEFRHESRMVNGRRVVRHWVVEPEPVQVAIFFAEAS